MVAKSVLVDTNILNNVVNDILLSNDFYLIKNTTDFEDSNLYLNDNPSSLYYKHDRIWLRIRYHLYIDVDQKMIPYAFHGYLNDRNELVTRECHSLHHKMISNGIEELLNANKIGQIIKEIAN